MAVILDAKYSKREILEAYLNDIYLGRNRSISILGVGEAARFYFGKPVSEINVARGRAAGGDHPQSEQLLAVRAARTWRMQRRSTVLGLMLKQKKIDAARRTTRRWPRRCRRGRSAQRSGLASIPFYVDRVLQEMARDYGIKDVKGRGLQIYTAIDLNAQDTAARTLEAGLAALEKGSRRLRRARSAAAGSDHPRRRSDGRDPRADRRPQLRSSISSIARSTRSGRSDRSSSRSSTRPRSSRASRSRTSRRRRSSATRASSSSAASPPTGRRAITRTSTTARSRCARRWSSR